MYEGDVEEALNIIQRLNEVEKKHNLSRVAVVLPSQRIKLAALKGSTCKWWLDDDDWNAYASECGMMWILESGTPVENDIVYCHKCGRRVEYVITKTEQP